MTGWIIFFVVLAILIAALVGLYIWGTKMQKKSEAQREQLNAAAQTVSMLVIDKKRMKMIDANLPKMVIEQTPKRFRKAKMPIVKAKIGPQIMSLICDEGIFDQIPVKAEVKAQVSGIYIVGVKNLRVAAPTPEKKKKGFMARLRKKQSELQNELQNEKKSKSNSQKKKK